MHMSPEYIQLTLAAKDIIKDGATYIYDKLKAIRALENKDEIIERLNELINKLVEDKNSLINIINAYEEKLIMQKISDEDIEYITESIIPLLEKILEEAENDDAAKAKEAMKLIKPILSKETFNILQLLGFNFKQAIGEPLTQLVSAFITSRIPVTAEKELEYQMLVEQKQIEYFKIIQDEKASERLLKFSKNE